ncbi:hypothetical protein [Thermofilum pendens]|uniref:Uncharacterized protein n=1 Tax=Thermofilum pendens (strain DSM 2475 / Hrk 5) TaxID=368408 RepID=A1RXZ1_THEPD|nr:hypothetical protein [Thermofilum pendens]ABL78071.1 hypothetical protein Tpen_0669 [Thermofilum pendens Hrk 5]
MLEDLELLLLLSYTEAPPSHVFKWLEEHGYSYKASRSLLEAARSDEESGSRHALRTILGEKVSRLETKLETFSRKSESLAEIFSITLLSAPLMLYSLALFNPRMVAPLTLALMTLNAVIIFTYSSVYPRELRALKVGPIQVILAALPFASLALLSLPPALVLAALAAFSLPGFLYNFTLVTRVQRELRENLELLVRVASAPFHAFKTVKPEKLLAGKFVSNLTPSVRLSLFLSAYWGTDREAMLGLKNTYEKILRILHSLQARALLNGLTNLVGLFLLGFASSLISQLLESIARVELLQSVGVPADVRGLEQWFLAYLLFACMAYSGGISALSFGTPLLLPLWLPAAALAALAGLSAGRNLVIIHG